MVIMGVYYIDVMDIILNRFIIVEFIMAKNRIIIRQDRQDSNNSLQVLMQHIQCHITNLNYHYNTYYHHDLITLFTNLSTRNNITNTIFTLGKPINNTIQYIQLQNQMIWITYRKNFSINESMSSDNGWGCLLRVAQMALANFIRNMTGCNEAVIRRSMIKLFLQEGGAYNMSNLLREGCGIWGKKVGDWFSIGEVVVMLQSLQQKSTAANQSHLKIRAYNETINIDDLMQALSPNQHLLSSSDSDDINYTQIPSQRDQSQSKRTVMLIVSKQIKTRVVERQDYEALLGLMELRMFRGMLGGIPGQARFITGKYQDKMVYLDPHYVQEAVDQQSLDSRMQTFSCKEYRWMSGDELDANMALCFEIKSVEDISELKKAIDAINKQLRKKQKESYFISYEQSETEDSTDYDQTQQVEPFIDEIQILRRISSDQIEILM